RIPWVKRSRLSVRYFMQNSGTLAGSMAYDIDTSARTSCPSLLLNTSSSLYGCPSPTSAVHFTVCTNSCAEFSLSRVNRCAFRRESCLVPLWTPDGRDQARNHDQQRERPHDSAPQPQVAGQVHPVEKAAE